MSITKKSATNYNYKIDSSHLKRVHLFLINVFLTTLNLPHKFSNIRLLKVNWFHYSQFFVLPKYKYSEYII